MKHIKKFEGTQEKNNIEDIPNPNISKSPLGFVFKYATTIYYGSSMSFDGFAKKIIYELIGKEDDLENFYYDLSFMLGDLSYYSPGYAQLLDDSSLWTGLEPKKVDYFDYFEDVNPVISYKTLKDNFSNLDEIMLRHSSGNPGVPDYISKSIENDIELVKNYVGYDSANPKNDYSKYFTFDEIMSKVRINKAEKEKIIKGYKALRFV